MNSKDFKCWWKNLGCSSLFFDGASKGNQGMAGAGGVYFGSEGIKLKEYAWGIDKKTNNGAEWLALKKDWSWKGKKALRNWWFSETRAWLLDKQGN